jgi:hypothetical protein
VISGSRTLCNAKHIINIDRTEAITGIFRPHIVREATRITKRLHNFSIVDGYRLRKAWYNPTVPSYLAEILSSQGYGVEFGADLSWYERGTGSKVSE